MPISSFGHSLFNGLGNGFNGLGNVFGGGTPNTGPSSLPDTGENITSLLSNLGNRALSQQGELNAESLNYETQSGIQSTVAMMKQRALQNQVKQAQTAIDISMSMVKDGIDKAKG